MFCQFFKTVSTIQITWLLCWGPLALHFFVDFRLFLLFYPGKERDVIWQVVFIKSLYNLWHSVQDIPTTSNALRTSLTLSLRSFAALSTPQAPQCIVVVGFQNIKFAVLNTYKNVQNFTIHVICVKCLASYGYVTFRAAPCQTVQVSKVKLWNTMFMCLNSTTVFVPKQNWTTKIIIWWRSVLLNLCWECPKNSC